MVRSARRIPPRTPEKTARCGFELAEMRNRRCKKDGSIALKALGQVLFFSHSSVNLWHLGQPPWENT